MRHIVLDIETLSSFENAVVLQITAAMLPNIEEIESENDLFKEMPFINLKLEAASQLKRGRHVSKSTLEWWKSQGEEAKIAAFYPHVTDIDPVDAMDMFENWLEEIGYDPNNTVIWQRGSKDVDWLVSFWHAYGREFPMPWWKVRDVRTAVDVKGASSKFNGYPDITRDLVKMIPGYKMHDALSDVRLAALTLIHIGVV